MIPQEAVEKAARAIEQGINRDDSIWDLAQEALHAGFEDVSRELQRLRHADIDARVNRDTVIRVQDQLDAIQAVADRDRLSQIQKILDGQTETPPLQHIMVNLRWAGEAGTWVADCSCGGFSSGPVDYAGNAVALVRKHARDARGRHRD